MGTLGGRMALALRSGVELPALPHRGRERVPFSTLGYSLQVMAQRGLPAAADVSIWLRCKEVMHPHIFLTCCVKGLLPCHPIGVIVLPQCLGQGQCLAAFQQAVTPVPQGVRQS